MTGWIAPTPYLRARDFRRQLLELRDALERFEQELGNHASQADHARRERIVAALKHLQHAADALELASREKTPPKQSAR
jgi:hypothetical protein